MSIIAKGISKLFKPKRRRGPKAKAKAKEQVKVIRQERESKPVQKPPNREGQASTSKSKNPDAVFESGDNKIIAGRSSSPSIKDNTTKAQQNRANKIVALEKKVREGTATSAEKTELKRLDKINRDDTSRAAKSGAFTRGTPARKERLKAPLQRKDGGKIKNKKTVKPKSKSKSKVITVSPGKPYYSSKELGEGYEERLPSAVYSADLRKRSPFGKASPKAAGLDVVAEFQNLSRGKEGKTGSRLAKKTAKELVKKNAGGKVKGYKKGGSITYRMSGGQVVGHGYD